MDTHKITHKIILTRGIQGSGKSTWARKWVTEKPLERIRVNNDDIRNMMGSYWIPSREHLVDTCVQNIVKNAMKSGYDIVIDNMNLNKSTVKRWYSLVKNHNSKLPLESIYKIETHNFFDVPLDECILRDSLRKEPIGEVVIKETYNKYKNILQK